MEGQGNTEYVVNLRHADDGLLAKGSKARHTKLYSTLGQLSIVSLGQLLAEVVEKVPRRRGRSNNGIDGLAKWNLGCAAGRASESMLRRSILKIVLQQPQPQAGVGACVSRVCLASPLKLAKTLLSGWR